MICTSALLAYLKNKYNLVQYSHCPGRSPLEAVSRLLTWSVVMRSGREQIPGPREIPVHPRASHRLALLWVPVIASEALEPGQFQVLMLIMTIWLVERKGNGEVSRHCILGGTQLSGGVFRDNLAM